MEKELMDIGLSKNEAKIYLFLLRNQNVTTGKIIRETRVANSRVYESLNSLISRGIVSYNVQRDGKHFQAENPKKFLELEEQRKKKINELLPHLEKLENQTEGETRTAVYEGYEGFKTAFRKIIEDCPNNEEILIMGFSEPEKKSESLRLFLSNMNLKSAQKKQRLKLLLDKKVKETLGKDREKEKYTEVRYMPEGYISPAAVDIFQDYVYMFLWEEKPFVFMIKNEKIAESFRQYFKFLWSLSKK